MKNILKDRKIFKGLFWQIFFAIWLTNILILFTASFAIIGKIEEIKFNNLLEQSVVQYASMIIERYESKQSVDVLPDSRSNHPKSSQQLSRRRPPMAVDTLQIVDANGVVIFERSKKGYEITPNNPLSMTLEVSGLGDKIYQVHTVKPEPPRFIKDIIHRIKSLRLILIFVATTIASALLSWGIAKPLKQLAAFNQQFAGGRDPIEIPGSLLTRADEIGELAREFQAMTRQVNTTIDNQKQLLHDVSHELRAPLARLQTAVALQEQVAQNDQYSHIIHKELGRINHLIQCILDFSRLNQSNDVVEEFELNELINECVDSASISCPDRHIQFTALNNSLNYRGFPDALGSAIDNFINNACKYSPSETNIDITLVKADNQCRIIVRDYGPGVPEPELDKIGIPFYRASNSIPADGFGLGLSIARKAVEKNNGTLEFANHPEGGLLVTITLPIDIA